MSGKLVAAFRKTGPDRDRFVRTLLAGLARPELIPFRFGDNGGGSVYTVRKALVGEGPAGSLVVELEEGGVTRLLCNEDGPVLDATGPMRKRSVRLPDAMWAELQRRGDPSDLIRQAIAAFLAG